MNNAQKLDFIISLTDKVSGPTQKVTSKVLKAQELVSCGFKTMQGAVFGIVGSARLLGNLTTPAREFSKALNEVRSLGVVQDELTTLSKAAKDFTGSFGGNAADFVRSAYDIQSAIPGLVKGELASFATVANVTAKATKAAASDMTSYMGTMYGIFSKQADEMGRAKWADQLGAKTAKAVEMFKTTGPAMSAAFTNIGSAAKLMGVELDEQLAVLGTLQTTMGGERAGTGYAALMRDLPKANGKMGLNFTDESGKLKPIYEIVSMLEDKLGNLSNVQRAKALKNIFGSDESIKTIQNLWGQSEKLKNSIESIAKIDNLDQATTMANAMKDPLEIATANWNNFLITAGTAFLPALNAILGAFSSLMQYVSNFLAEYPSIASVISGITTALIALTTAMSAYHFVVGMVKVMVGNYISVVETCKKVISGLKFAVFSIKYYFTVWNIALKANQLWQGIVKASTLAYTAVVNFLKVSLFGNLKAFVLNTAALVAQKAALLASVVVMNAVKLATITWTALQWALNVALTANPIGLIIIGIAALVAAIAAAIIYWDEIVAWCGRAWGAIKDFFAGAGQIARTVFNAIGIYIHNMLYGVVSVITTSCDYIVGIFANMAQGLIAFASSFVAPFASCWTSIISGVSTLFSTISALFSNLWARIACFASSFASFFSAVKQGASALVSFVSTCFDGLWNGVFARIARAGEFVTSFFVGVKNTALNIGHSMSAFYSGVWDSITSGASAMFDAVSTLFSRLWHALSSPFVMAWESISAIFDNIEEAAFDFVDYFLSAFSFVGDFIMEMFRPFVSLWNKISSLWDGTPITMPETSHDNLSTAETVRPNFVTQSNSASHIINNQTSFGSVNISVRDGMTPAQLAEWSALQA